MSRSKPRIAIAGGGPGGLTLGLLLHKRGIPFTIFELRPKPTEEELAKPSGMLDLHDESGIAAITECGLLKEFQSLTGECSEAQKVSDKNGDIVYADNGEDSDRPEISRHALSKLLMAHIPADQIKWNHKIVSVTSTNTHGQEEIELDLGPSGKQTFDLVIGADGAWSKVRNLLTDVQPSYMGTQNITLTIRGLTKKYPHLAKLVGAGSFAALADHHGVMTQRGPQDSVRVSVFVSTDDEHFAKTVGLAGKTAGAAKEKLLNDEAILGTWGPVMKELVSAACDEEVADNPGAEVDARPLYLLPVGSSWEHKPGATLIGDASHLMGPWAGEGVNLAMWDALLLAHTIEKAYAAGGDDAETFQKGPEPLMKDFEVDMAARAKEKAEESVSNGKMLFCEDGARAFRDFFHSFRPPFEEEAAQQ